MRQLSRKLLSLLWIDAPVARAAPQNVSPTTATNTNSIAVRNAVAPPASPTSGTAAAARSTKFRNVGDWEKLSNAVEPSNTARTATVPGRTGSVGRWSSGLTHSTRPVPRARRKGDIRDTAMLYTSKGSARANHRAPKTQAPIPTTAA